MTSLKNNLIKKILNQTNIFIFFLIINIILLSSIKCELSNIKSNNIQPNHIVNTSNQTKIDNDIKVIDESFKKIQKDINKLFSSFEEIIEFNRQLNDKLEQYRKGLQKNYQNKYNENSNEFFDEFEKITGLKNSSSSNVENKNEK